MRHRVGPSRTVLPRRVPLARRIGAIVTPFLLIAVACLGARLLAQGPGAPPDGQVHEFYFDTHGYTEVWVTFTPAPIVGATSSPLILNVTIRYAGKPAEGPLTVAPDAIVLRATSNPFFNPTLLRQPVVRISVDGELAWDPALPVNFYSSGGLNCEGCAPDTVDVRVPPDALRRIATGKAVEGHALGFAFELRQTEQRVLLNLLEAVFGPNAGEGRRLQPGPGVMR